MPDRQLSGSATPDPYQEARLALRDVLGMEPDEQMIRNTMALNKAQPDMGTTVNAARIVREGKVEPVPEAPRYILIVTALGDDTGSRLVVSADTTAGLARLRRHDRWSRSSPRALRVGRAPRPARNQPMTEQQYPTREQITTAVRPVISQWYDTGGNLQERIADVVLALFPQPTQECGVCGSQYPADDPHDTCPVCWPGFGEHGQQATASTERKPSGCPCGYHPIDSPNASGPLPAAPPSIADMAQMDLAAQTAAVRYVDAEYMEEGGSTRHWVQALNRAGYVIAPDPSTIRDVTPPPKTPEAN